MAIEKRILVINPNTNEASTKNMERYCNEIAAPGTTVVATNPEADESFTCPSILCYVDREIAATKVAEIAAKEQKNYDGIIIAAHSDPGINAAREICSIPVVGIGESSYVIASMLGHRFSVIGDTPKGIPNVEQSIRILGLETKKLASVVPYYREKKEAHPHLKLTKESQMTQVDLLEAAGKIALEEDNAEVLIPGGGGWCGLYKELQERLGATVVDPLSWALKITEAMIDLGVTHSKVRLWAKPPERLVEGPDYKRPFKIE